MAPVLEQPSEETVEVLPSRSARVAAETDVLVVGGGPAGLGAALGASRAGARVVLVEQRGFLGGAATANLIIHMMSYHLFHPRHRELDHLTLFPLDQGPSTPVVAGVVREFVERLVERGGALNPTPQTGYVVPFDAETFKSVAQELLDEADVEVLLHAFASGVTGVRDGVRGVVFETKSGPLLVKAQVMVDGTGDGDIAAAAGAHYRIGNEVRWQVQPMTMIFRVQDFSRPEFAAYVRAHPDQWHGVHGLRKLIAKATAAGDLDLKRENILMWRTTHPAEVAVNSTRISHVIGCNVFDLTKGEVEGRRQVDMVMRFFKKYVPGFKHAFVTQTGEIGVRESRRIIGEYMLTTDDLLGPREFDDVIARGTYPIDIHNPEGKGTLLRHIPAGKAYEIPLRCLIPKKIEGLLVAGRCISGTHEALASYRVIPESMATGQAAGVCAALAFLQDRQPKDVPIRDVQDELVRQGANLGNYRSRRIEPLSDQVTGETS